MDVVAEIEKLLRDGRISDAFALILREAPEDVRRIIERSLRKPDELKRIEGFWKNLALIAHFVNTSHECSKSSDSRSLVSCVIASVNAVKLCEELGMRSPIPQLLLNAARALSMMDMKERAERMLIEAEKICEELGDDEMLADVDNFLAVLYFETERYADAKVKIEEALEIRRRLGTWDKIAESLTNAAEVYVKLGDFDAAENCYAEAEKIYRDLSGDEKSYAFDLAILLSNYGMFLRRLGRFDDAERKFREALEIFESLEEKDPEFAQFVATALRHLGDLKREVGEFTEAEKYYRLSSEKFREIQARWESVAS